MMMARAAFLLIALVHAAWAANNAEDNWKLLWAPKIPDNTTGASTILPPQSFAEAIASISRESGGYYVEGGHPYAAFLWTRRPLLARAVAGDDLVAALTTLFRTTRVFVHSDPRRATEKLLRRHPSPVVILQRTFVD